MIEVCRAYVAAQHDFAAEHPLGKGREYAQRFQSHDGTHDGLYWPAENGVASPLGPLIAAATAEGYADNEAPGARTPYHGYYYKILTRQGLHAAGGTLQYLNEGHMTRGFALIAFPATYGDLGIVSFIVNENGIVFEKNLGPHTALIAAHMNTYDPDLSWKIVP